VLHSLPSLVATPLEEIEPPLIIWDQYFQRRSPSTTTAATLNRQATRTSISRLEITTCTLENLKFVALVRTHSMLLFPPHADSIIAGDAAVDRGLACPFLSAGKPVEFTWSSTFSHEACQLAHGRGCGMFWPQVRGGEVDRE